MPQSTMKMITYNTNTTQTVCLAHCIGMAAWF